MLRIRDLAATRTRYVLQDLHPAAQGGLGGEPQACLPALPGRGSEPSAQATQAQRQRGEPRAATCGVGGERDVVDGLRFGRAVRRPVFAR